MRSSHSPAITGSLGKAAGRSYALGALKWRRTTMPTLYLVTDRLHYGRTVRVPGDEITATVSAWLAELGARSPLVADLSRAVSSGDWPATHAIGERLSIDISTAA
jgi:hypothetical protein